MVEIAFNPQNHGHIRQKTIEFLRAYEAKRLEDISKFFTQDVVLQDWNYRVEGISAALAEYQKNFSQSQSLQINIKQIYVSDGAAAASIEVIVNQTDFLNLVDIVSFNSEGQISSIYAYKGL